MERGRLEIWPQWRDVLGRAHLQTVADVLARGEVVRDLPDRANLRLELEGVRVHAKLRKARFWHRFGAPRGEIDGLVLAQRLAIPVPPLVFQGFDARRGQVVGTLDLAPARPLDELLVQGALPPDARRRALNSLAAHVAILHASGYHHRDLYLNHVFVDPARDDPVVALIDWDRFGRHTRPLGRWVVKDLAALEASCPPGTVGEAERARFLARYLRARTEDLRSTSPRLVARVQRKAARIRAHVPRTPVGDAARPASTRGPQ